jgi:hypothetical protein
MAEARRQLSPLYGYFWWTRAGILETFFARYLEDDARAPVPFLDWVETRYDPEQVMRSFQQSRILGAPGVSRGPAGQ